MHDLEPSQKEADRLAEGFRRYAHLIRPIARHLSVRQPDLMEDLVQVGSIGLLRALGRFDSRQEATFERYASACIAGEMRHYLRDQAPLVRPPRELLELRGRVLQAQHLLAQEGEPGASSDAIARRAGLPAAKVEEVLLLEEQGAPTSLDDEQDTETGGARYQLIDNRYTSFQLATDDRIMVESALGRLRAVSREVIEFAFYEDLSQTEIAKQLGISQMQVSRRLRKAMDELWKVLNTRLC